LVNFSHTFAKAEELTYFAFHYPYSYSDCMDKLDDFETRFSDHKEIYFKRELLTHSIEKRRVDLITITDHHNITSTHEELIPRLFPDHYGDVQRRPFK
jgi:hypothetical protein